MKNIKLTNEEKKDIATLAISIPTTIGVSTVINYAIKAALPAQLSIGARVVVAIGSFALSHASAEMASAYMVRKFVTPFFPPESKDNSEEVPSTQSV